MGTISPCFIQGRKMKNYIGLLQDIMSNGIDREDRTSIGSSRTVFGKTLRFNLADGFPIITTRKTTFRIAFEETMFFLRGETNTTKLEDKNITIWKDNTSREFLDNRGLHHLPEGSLGTGYSHQWRNFGGELGGNDGVDQIKELITELKENPNSRRHVVSAWNPQQLDDTPLPPCHILHTYQVLDGKLNSLFFMRSNDAYHGLPFNIMSYAFLNMAFANILDLEPGELVYMGADVHIYQNQFEVVNQQIEREPFDLPELILPNLKSLDDLLNLEYNDIELRNYETHPALQRVQMAV